MRKLIILPLLFLTTLLGAQQYQIQSVTYEIDGVTQEDVIAPIIAINTTHIFSSPEELEQYFAVREALVQQFRTLETILIIPTYGTLNEQNIIPVDVLVKVKDSWNLIPLPYPKYDSNTGTEFKLKIIDYNFLGLMRILDNEIVYRHDTYGDNDDHYFSGASSVTLPFMLGPFHSNWSNSFGLNYMLENDYPTGYFSTGLGFYYPLNSSIGLSLGLAQGITYDHLHEESGDALFFTQAASLSISVFLAWNEFLGGIYWTPNMSASYDWDIDGIKPTNLALYDNDLNIGHTLSSWNIQWVGNFRKGIHLSVSQSLHKKLYTDQLYLYHSLTGIYYKAFEHAQIASRLYIFENLSGNHSDIGGYIRGTYSIASDSAIVINFDLPIKVWQTDWVGYGLWDWTEFFDFELQLSPFIDIAFGKNYYPPGKSYNLKDSWYTVGLEALVYPNKMRSLQGRVSLGVDVVRFAELVGNRIGFVGSVVDKVFGDTAWRWISNKSWYELFIGIGLHY